MLKNLFAILALSVALVACNKGSVGHPYYNNDSCNDTHIHDFEKVSTVYFDFNSSKIKAAEMMKVKAQAEWLKHHADYKVMLAGHTDSKGGNSPANMRLSKKRAASVKKMLVKHGVSADRVSTDGFGATKLAKVGPYKEVAGYNRRVSSMLAK